MQYGSVVQFSTHSQGLQLPEERQMPSTFLGYQVSQKLIPATSPLDTQGHDMNLFNQSAIEVPHLSPKREFCQLAVAANDKRAIEQVIALLGLHAETLKLKDIIKEPWKAREVRLSDVIRELAQANAVSPSSKDRGSRWHLLRLLCKPQKAGPKNLLNCLAHALAAISINLDMFQVTDALHWQPLEEFESRELKGGKYMEVLYDQQHHKGDQVADPRALLAQRYTFPPQHALVSITDQGAVNLGGLDYITYHLKLTVLCAHDRQHRTYNDLKSALRVSRLLKSFFGLRPPL
eukprot:s4050_g1.t1